MLHRRRRWRIYSHASCHHEQERHSQLALMVSEEVMIWVLHGWHVKVAVTLAVCHQQDSHLSEESGSEEDAPSIRRLLEAQQAGSEDTDGDEPGTAALATRSTAEASHSSAAPAGALVEREVCSAHMCSFRSLSPCSIRGSPNA